MGYRELESNIRADFKRDLDAVVRSSEEEVRRINEETRKMAEDASAKVLAHGENTAALRHRKIVGAGRLESMRAFNAEKNRLVDGIFTSAREAFMALPNERKAKLLKKLAEDAALTGMVNRVKVDKSYRRLLKGAKGMKVVEGNLGDFGVILESADGLMTVDNRLNTIINQAKTKLKPQVNRILFG
jgi:vacuolar-type H+-ATPase subunit E/Vma4